jgi:hypothetical protein
LENEANEKGFAAFKWQPGQDTGFAIGTLILFWICYLIGTHFTVDLFKNVAFVANSGFMRWLVEFIAFLAFTVFGTLFLNVYFPLAYVVGERKEGLEGVGIKSKNLVLSLIISVALAAVFLFALPGNFQVIDLSAPVYEIVLAAASLWAPFFVFGWLQMRFDRAFGAILGIILTGVSFAIYHIGSVGFDQVLVYLVVGLGLAVVFRLTRNVFIVWPLAWIFNPAVSTVLVGAEIDWGRAILYAVILVFQIGAISWVARGSKGVETITT